MATVIEKKLRVILITHGADEEIVRLLVALDGVTLAGIFIETETVRRYSLREKIRRSLRYDGYLGTLAKVGRPIINSLRSGDNGGSELRRSQKGMERIAQEHGVPTHYVTNYHSEEAIALMRLAGADLGIVFGTNILKESVFKIPRLGSINLHQGRAPYYRGGPPVFWELFNDELEVGLTVHFVEAKVDTGEIILQEMVPLVYDYGYGLDFERYIAAFMARMRSRCAHLVVEAVRQIAEGTANPWAQDVECGRRYRLPVKSEKDELRRRLLKRQKLGSATMIPLGIENRGD